MLSLLELEQLKDVDIHQQSIGSLSNIDTIKMNSKESLEKRIISFLAEIQNPYCYRCGDVVVKIEYSKSCPSLQNVLSGFLIQQKQNSYIVNANEK